MLIKIKDVKKFKKEIIRQGYSLEAFSKKIEANRFTLNSIFRREKISPSKAKKATEVLGADFDKFFLII